MARFLVNYTIPALIVLEVPGLRLRKAYFRETDQKHKNMYGCCMPTIYSLFLLKVQNVFGHV